MHGRAKSLTLVIIQFACLFFIAWTGPILARQPLLLIIELLGLGLGVWAIVAMRFFNFNITPDVKVDGYLVERGPYAFIRHPMYTSLILICLALVANTFSWTRAAVFFALIIDLVIKLRYEEGLLSAHYSQYADYMTRSKRLLPTIW
jgi:protein-S-isoprenylcysteine O-methyltransferase Ste14